MGCLCSKEAGVDEVIDENVKVVELSKSSVQLFAPSKVEDPRGEISGINDVSAARKISKVPSQGNNGSSLQGGMEERERKSVAPENPTRSHHQRGATMDLGFTEGQKFMSGIASLPHGAEGEENVAGWPTWLTSVAGEAIRGMVPRRAESFKKLKQIGQGTYSCVYKAHDLETGKIVAMKKVRFANMDPESVRFMAREIHILRTLDHPNVMKLEDIVTSRISGSLYLVFEYMEHDLTGILARPGSKLSEPQIKCYMQQLFQGLEHCHSRGILHRDIKGSNLLINDDGILKIGDFGLATFFHPDQRQPLTSRVVTLWYRAPELLLGAAQYGVGIDMWSTGCILAELFAGEPIMPGRTEVEQLHKIFKLCGSPSDDYWLKHKLPNATTFRSQVRYKRRVAEKFKDCPPTAVALIGRLLAIEPKERGTAVSALRSEFFSTKPLPCHRSRLPKYPPSKEFDIKLRDVEARRKRAESVKGRGPEYSGRGSREAKPMPMPSPEFEANGEVSLQGKPNPKSVCQDAGPGFSIEPLRVNRQKGYCNSMVHPSVAQSSWTTQASSLKKNDELRTKEATSDMCNQFPKRDERGLSGEPAQSYVPKKNRIHYSGPLIPPGGNLEDMLKEHEKQIQQAVRNSHMERKTRNSYSNFR